MLLEKAFERTIDALRQGTGIPLRVELWTGQKFDLSRDPKVTIGIPEASALRYFVSPDLSKLGEAFVEGHIRVEGAIGEVFSVAESIARRIVGHSKTQPRPSNGHSPERDRRAIEYHYDVSDEFYSLFLDPRMVYSCAYFAEESDSLETAQLRKLDHILTKLRVQPGERLLDIGCGWGALVMRAAEKYGAIATGITLSKNQCETARRRIRDAGLADRCSVELLDYREVAGERVFDKIASVGMLEHVGLANLPEYFARIGSLLKDGGLSLSHGITTSDPDSHWLELGAGEFIDRYVFPDGELPHLSLVVQHMARAGLEVYDVESLRRHYARTCLAWSGNLERNRAHAAAIAGEKRCRIWQIYLAGCAFGFANGWINVYQVLAGRADAARAPGMPMTRDYMYRASADGNP